MTRPKDWIGALTARVNEALLGETSWQSFLELCRTASSQRTAQLFYHDSRDHSGSITISHGMEPEALKSYAEYYAKLNPWMSVLPKMRLGSALGSDAVLERSTLKDTQFYTDYLRPNSFGNSVGLLINRDGRRNFMLGMLDDHWMGGDSSAALAHLGALAPQLRRISDFYHRNHLRMLMDPMSTRMSLQAGMGLLQLDLLGSVKACNDIGADILAKGYPLRQGPKGRICFCSDRVAEAFKRLTRDIIQRSGPVSAQTGFEGGYELCFVANGLDDAATAFIGPTITLLVTMDKAKHLALQNQLSPAETRILHALIEGHKPKQIAEINNVSVQTIRSQLKSIFTKTGVKSQSELVVICAQGGLGLGPKTTPAAQSLS